MKTHVVLVLVAVVVLVLVERESPKGYDTKK